MSQKEPHELKFAFSDFIALIKTHKKKVITCMLAGALLCILFSITRPVTYIVKASFRDKGKAQVGIGNPLTELFFQSNGVQESEAATTMKSRSLIASTLSKLHLQGKVEAAPQRYPDIVRAFENFLSEYAYWKDLKTPILADPQDPLSLRDINYSGEVALVYKAHFVDEEHYELTDASDNLIGNGKLGTPIITEKTSFTLVKDPAYALEPTQTVALIFYPMAELSAIYAGSLQIDPDKEDKTLLKLQFRHRDRALAALFLNTLMESFQKHLSGEHELTSDAQLHYLQKRQKEVGAELQKQMEEHVKKVSEEMAESGFTSLQHAMEFLSQSLAENQEKLQEIELETRRLRSFNPNSLVQFDSNSKRSDPALINQMVNELRALKQESETFELALQQAPIENKGAKDKLSLHFDQLKCADQCLKEAEELALWLEEERKDAFPLKALKSNNYPIAAWIDAIKEKERAKNFASPGVKQEKAEEYAEFKKHLQAYLENFSHLMAVRKSFIEKRLEALQNPQTEIGGLTLDSCRELYLGFTRDLNQSSTLEKQHRFVADQLKDPSFEICSLTALLQDPVSQERIQKASQLAIQIKDETNHTQKELDRLKGELALQKQFLSSHILQIADLLKLKESMMKEKIAELQAVTLEQIQQKASLLKKTLADFVESRIHNLSQEKELIAEHQAELQTKMTEIPEKWASEQLLNQNLAMHQRFLENLSSMVESKNITKNLEMIQSSPLDRAIPSLNPKSPSILFYAILGSILGFLGSSSLLFASTMMKGLPASRENLHLANFHVSGTITPFQGDETSATYPMLDNDLDTLRRLIAHFENSIQEPGRGRKILLIQGKGPDFFNTLAMLLSKKGQKIIKINLCFNRDSTSKGLLQYLERESEEPIIEKLSSFDWIASGGSSRYSEELLRSPRFKSLIEKLEKKYDWILATSSASIPSAEAENLSALFDGTAIDVTDESIQSLIAFSKTLPPKKQEALTFLFA
jgi:tyrosine-protein kinase Etk/Wzc